MIEESVVLVNPQDEVLGLCPKLQAHEQGLLHRAFSVFLFNEQGDFLLQKRAKNKYHSPELWTNTCCSHPKANESYVDGATRRLQEELGIQNVTLTPAFYFIYKAPVGNGLIEHELDHVFVGQYTGIITPNTLEIMDTQYLQPSVLKNRMINQPQEFTEWFKIIYAEYLDRLE